MRYTLGNMMLLVAVTAFVCFILGGVAGDCGMQDAAVKKGHAEYCLDDDHNKQWRWLPIEKKASEK